MAIATSFRLQWNQSIAVQLEAAVEEAAEETAQAAKEAAIEKCPVGDGSHEGVHLYETIDAQVDAGGGHRTIVLFADKPYDLFVELGTSRMAAQPFIRPAMDQEAPKLGGRIRAKTAAIR